MKILIIDDSPDSRVLAKARLVADDYEILCAEGGKTGLDIARAQSPDLVLLDVDMPDMSGFDVCRCLQADESMRVIPIIFLSGSVDMADRIRGLDMGAVDFVTKPFDGFELKARVRAALRTKHLQDMLRDRAQIDPLTELYNRWAFQERLDQEWARSVRYGSPVSLVMADIDLFKSVNDHWGHPAGDRVLREFACRITATCRKSDTAFRYGGEEFTIMLPQTDLDMAKVLAERLRVVIADSPMQAMGQPLQITASFGVAGSEELIEPGQLIQAADKALYQAKAAGRNCVRAFPPDPRETPEDMGTSNWPTSKAG